MCKQFVTTRTLSVPNKHDPKIKKDVFFSENRRHEGTGSLCFYYSQLVLPVYYVVIPSTRGTPSLYVVYTSIRVYYSLVSSHPEVSAVHSLKCTAVSVPRERIWSAFKYHTTIHTAV